MGFSIAVLIYGLAYHAYGPRPKKDSMIEKELWKLGCHSRLKVLSALAWRVRRTLYPRPQRRAHHIVSELAYHAVMLAAAGMLGMVGTVLGALVKRPDPMRHFVAPPCKPRYAGPDAETLWREITAKHHGAPRP